MHSHLLRELAKVATGLFLADLVSVIWLGAAGFFPLTILGVTWTESAILPIAVFDIAMLLLLIHWGWRMKLPLNSPTERNLLGAAGVIFAIVALVHLMRLAFGWNLILGTFAVPLWLSWFGFFITAYLSYTSLHFARRVSK